MTKILQARHVAALAVLAASTMLATPADAADCPAFTNPVYVIGSSASQPVLASIAGVLAAAATPVTVVYIKTESCQLNRFIFLEFLRRAARLKGMALPTRVEEGTVQTSRRRPAATRVAAERVHEFVSELLGSTR